ncbi:MAG TPA: ferritin family protein [Candidatus Omnitrophota bacterium]|nr:ferritin family protein [Candidatus Omnitrophota bacterium]HPS21115.1 ferritin family protein [Candidatus Omnitrophota bacterium]
MKDKAKYTAKDVLEMVIQAKSKGVDFYMALARNSENYHVAQLFAALAKDEQKHKLALEKWKKTFKTDKKDEAYPGEKTMFLKALVDESIFLCGDACKRVLKTTISEEEALKVALNFEKDFMLFLHELKYNLADAQGSSTIDKLLDEEAQHVRDMFKLVDKI